MTTADPTDERRHKTTHIEATTTACGIEWDNDADVVIRPRRTPDWGLVNCYRCLDTQPTVVAAGGWCAPATTVYGGGGGVITRERALWRGLVEPTEEEKTKAAHDLHEQYLADKAAWEETDAFLAHVEAWKPAGIEKDILELHQCSESGHCDECSDEYEAQWPCRTARLVLHNNYIDVPERLVYDEPESPWQDENNPRWPFPSGPVDTRLTFPSIAVNRGGIAFTRKDT